MERSSSATNQAQDETLGQLIQRTRLALGMSQETLAERVGMSRAYMSQIESGERKWPAKFIAALSRELGILPSVLGRAAGRIIRDEDYDYLWPDRPQLRPTVRGTPDDVAAAVAEADEDDPWLRVVFAGAPNLSPAGRRALAAQFEHIRQLEAEYRKEAERDAVEGFEAG